MILAAGLGTRLKPFTDQHPKALARVNNKTILQRNIDYLKSFGVTDIIINVHHFADQILAHVEANNNFATPLPVTQERTRRSNVKQETNEEFTRITRSRSIRLGTTSSSSSSSRTDQNILKITTPSINTQSVDSRRSIKRVTTLRR